jgi:hypothetical protein
LVDLSLVTVARHHWSPEQLQYFDAGKRPSTPVSSRQLNDLTQRTSTFDQRFKFKHRNGDTLYFQSPNIPRDHFSNLHHAVSSTAERSAIRQEGNKYAQLHAYSEKFERRTLESFVQEQEKENLAPSPRRVTPNKPPKADAGSSSTISQLKKRARQSLQRSRKKGLSGYANEEPVDVEGILEDFMDNNSASRYQFLSTKWHSKNPSAARDFFDFHSLEELTLYIQSFFSEIAVIIPQTTIDEDSKKLT